MPKSTKIDNPTNSHSDRKTRLDLKIAKAKAAEAKARIQLLEAKAKLLNEGVELDSFDDSDSDDSDSEEDPPIEIPPHHASLLADVDKDLSDSLAKMERYQALVDSPDLSSSDLADVKARLARAQKSHALAAVKKDAYLASIRSHQEAVGAQATASAAGTEVEKKKGKTRPKLDKLDWSDPPSATEELLSLQESMKDPLPDFLTTPEPILSLPAPKKKGGGRKKKAVLTEQPPSTMVIEGPIASRLPKHVKKEDASAASSSTAPWSASFPSIPVVPDLPLIDKSSWSPSP